MTLQGRSLLTWLDYSVEEILFLLDLSKKVKAESKRHEIHQRFSGKTIALLFEKRSTRTRCVFETALARKEGILYFSLLRIFSWGLKNR